MSLHNLLSPLIIKAIQTNYSLEIEKVEYQITRKDFEGDCTVVLFPLLKLIKTNPAEIGNKIGTFLIENCTEVSKFNRSEERRVGKEC